MSPIRLTGSTSGYSQIDAPAVAGDQTFTLPGTGGTLDRLNRAGNILQVVQTVKTNTFSTSSTTFTDVTGLTATITPSSSSNKILILAQVVYSGRNGATDAYFFRLNGGNASSYVGDAASNRVRALVGNGMDVNISSASFTASLHYLDSPATTSATTYAVQARIGTSGNPAVVNYAIGDADTANYGRFASSIIVMEVAA